MLRKYLLGIVTFVFAFSILSVSVLESSSVSYVFATPPPEHVLGTEAPSVNYEMPYPGRILPDSPFWSFKAMRDRVWYVFTRNPLKKAELALLFSDKRIEGSKILFAEKKPDIALSTLTKGEKYLELAVNEEFKAREKGIDTSEFLVKLATASLKHRQMIEEMLPLAPEDAKPDLIRVIDYSKNAYNTARDVLNSKGIESPNNPFDGE